MVVYSDRLHKYLCTYTLARGLGSHKLSYSPKLPRVIVVIGSGYGSIQYFLVYSDT